jgi:hypothetical protein
VSNKPGLLFFVGFNRLHGINGEMEKEKTDITDKKCLKWTQKWPNRTQK